MFMFLSFFLSFFPSLLPIIFTSDDDVGERRSGLSEELNKKLIKRKEKGENQSERNTRSTCMLIYVIDLLLCMKLLWLLYVSDYGVNDYDVESRVTKYAA